jgi:iron(III) transport system ATP-binding protein
VMNQGVIEQIGTPIEIYRKPATPFVADFVGSMNFIEGEIAAAGRVRVGAAELDCAASNGYAPGTRVGLCLRPEDVAVRNIGPGTLNRIPVTIAELDFLGAFCRVTLKPEAGGTPIIADFSINLMRDLGVAEGQHLEVALPPDRIQVFAR